MKVKGADVMTEEHGKECKFLNKISAAVFLCKVPTESKVSSHLLNHCHIRLCFHLIEMEAS